MEEICRKLRLVVQEFGQDKVSMETVCVIGSDDSVEYVGGHRYIYAPTISVETLAGCSFKVARCFEDA
jgi:hypothetical protein